MKRAGHGTTMGISFTLSVISSLSLTVVYALGGQPQLEGLLLFISLGGIGLGLILWGKELMPSEPFVEERKAIPSGAEERQEAEAAFESGVEIVERRGFLAKLLTAALAALGVVALFPIRSLGTRPGRSLLHTRWKAGVRAVTIGDLPLRPADIPPNGVLTVFPEGHTDAADSQTLLIRFDLDEVSELPGPEEWTPQGVIAFSKICTHAGCPVGLYQTDSRELFCPCHQSVFAVLEGAKPIGGPATRPLPQLPLEIDTDGYIVARSDYPEPVGPGFWSRGRD
jgi:ubiquinol-cytochrome c reductase iron-sulfur subunit